MPVTDQTPTAVARRMLIDGRLTETGRTFVSLNPATGEVVGYAPDATADEAITVGKRPTHPCP
jgi:aldehyde dehydrogenase (NAD+)